MAKLKFINAEDFAKQYLYAANTFKYKLESLVDINDVAAIGIGDNLYYFE